MTTGKRLVVGILSMAIYLCSPINVKAEECLQLNIDSAGAVPIKREHILMTSTSHDFEGAPVDYVELKNPPSGRFGKDVVVEKLSVGADVSHHDAPACFSASLPDASSEYRCTVSLTTVPLVAGINLKTVNRKIDIHRTILDIRAFMEREIFACSTSQ